MGYSTETLVFQYHACRYTALAAIAVWVYDYLLTVADELELLWSRNGIVIKALYLVGRYLPIAGTAIFGGSLLPTWQPDRSNSICHITFTLLILCIMIQNLVSLTIFTMRLCTIFVMQRNVRRFLILTLVLTVLCYLALYGVALHYLVPNMVWNPLVRSCMIPNFNTWALGAIYLTPVFMDSVIFFSTIFHSVTYYRRISKLQGSSTGSILKRFYIDGTQYYGLVLALRIGTVCVFYLAPLGLQMLFRYLEYLVSSTLTSRYFLSFRRTILNATESEHGGTEMTSMSAQKKSSTTGNTGGLSVDVVED